MSRLRAHFMIPGHTRPITGEKTIKETLENYRDAIRFLYRRTIEEMNRGLTPDEIVEVVKLPPEISTRPYLQEFYGSVPWAVRSIFFGLLGWFNGNPSCLFPLPPVEEAKRLAALAGGEQKLIANLRRSIEHEDWQWACQLADHIMVLEANEADEARKLKVRALRALAEEQTNAPARNYYLSYAKEMSDD
jgi:uncharacterized sulfatase